MWGVFLLTIFIYWKHELSCHPNLILNINQLHFLMLIYDENTQIMGEIKLYILHEKIVQQGVKDKNKLFTI